MSELTDAAVVLVYRAPPASPRRPRLAGAFAYFASACVVGATTSTVSLLAGYHDDDFDRDGTFAILLVLTGVVAALSAVCFLGLGLLFRTTAASVTRSVVHGTLFAAGAVLIASSYQASASARVAAFWCWPFVWPAIAVGVAVVRPAPPRPNPEVP